jgi:hypothetical protein
MSERYEVLGLVTNESQSEYIAERLDEVIRCTRRSHLYARSRLLQGARMWTVVLIELIMSPYCDESQIRTFETALLARPVKREKGRGTYYPAYNVDQDHPINLVSSPSTPLHRQNDFKHPEVTPQW